MTLRLASKLASFFRELTGWLFISIIVLLMGALSVFGIVLYAYFFSVFIQWMSVFSAPFYP